MADPVTGASNEKAAEAGSSPDFSAAGESQMPPIEISSWELPEKLDSEKEYLIRSNIVRPDPLRVKIGCVDGRPYDADYKTFQTLGGFLNVVPLVRYSHWMSGDKVSYEDSFHEALEVLDHAGFQIGFHDGPHGRAEMKTLATGYDATSEPDCGFARKYADITAVLAFKADELKVLLNHGAKQNGIDPIIGETEDEHWDEITETARKVYSASSASEKQRFLTATEMFDRGMSLAGKSSVIPLEGEHKEELAHVNLVDGYTLDINAINRLGSQAFNLDLWLIRKQVREVLSKIGVDENIAVLQTLGMYQATERVLRPNKRPLPILVTRQEDQILVAA